MAAHMDDRRIARLCRERRYGELEALLAEAGLEDLAAVWAGLAPLEKLVAFKLLDAPRAMEFYASAPFDEKYFLLCGFAQNSIAPVLEDLPHAERRRFVQLPREFYDRMLRKLLAQTTQSAAAPGS